MPINNDQELLEAVIETRTLVREMHHNLYGNGNPGVLDKHEKDISDLKSAKNYIKGAAAVIIALFTAFGGILVNHLLAARH